MHALEYGEKLARTGVPIRRCQVLEAGVPKHELPIMRFEGIERLVRGVYGAPGKSPNVIVAAVQVRKGIPCLHSALFLHGLLDTEPEEAWLCIPHKGWKPRPLAPIALRIVRTSKRWTRDDVSLWKDAIPFTTIPRTVIDFHRYRKLFPPGTADQLAQRLIATQRTTLEELQATAARLGVRWEALKSARIGDMSPGQGDTPCPSPVMSSSLEPPVPPSEPSRER